MPSQKQERRERICDLNDQFRASSDRFGRVVLTAGVHGIGPEFIAAVVVEVSTYNAFTPDNDPHGEHDFGSFTLGGEELFWKIEYYDKTASSDQKTWQTRT